MAWVVFGEMKYWVGAHPKLGVVLLPPKRVHFFEKSEHVDLYVVEQKRFATFQAKTARDRIGVMVSESEAIDAVQTYLSLLHSRRNNFPEGNGPVLSYSYSDVVRETHCYQCKCHLSSRLNFVCGGCAWIVCPICGACGCGYENRMNAAGAD